MLAATIASISTPVCALVVALGLDAQHLVPAHAKRTSTCASGRGCASGMSVAGLLGRHDRRQLRGNERIALRQRRVAQRLGCGGLIRTSASPARFAP